MTHPYRARHAMVRQRFAGALAATLLAILTARANAAPIPPADPAREGDVVLKDFTFHSGDQLPELRLHYLALGRPRRDARGEVVNAVLILHGTGGSGRQFLSPQFAGESYRPGAPLDTTHYGLVLPDGIGHGRSSKPSDALHAHFPAYNYDDMVEAQRRQLEALGVRHLRLVMGTEPDWQGGEYTAQPVRALRTAADLLLLAGGAPIPMLSALATRDSADRWLARETALWKQHLTALLAQTAPR